MTKGEESTAPTIAIPTLIRRRINILYTFSEMNFINLLKLKRELLREFSVAITIYRYGAMKIITIVHANETTCPIKGRTFTI